MKTTLTTMQRKINDVTNKTMTTGACGGKQKIARSQLHRGRIHLCDATSCEELEILITNCNNKSIGWSLLLVFKLVRISTPTRQQWDALLFCDVTPPLNRRNCTRRQQNNFTTTLNHLSVLWYTTKTACECKQTNAQTRIYIYMFMKRAHDKVVDYNNL